MSLANLSTPEILADVMAAIKTRVPFLASAFTTDFSREPAKFNQTVLARITKVPAVQDYDAATGYQGNAASATTLMDEVPITIDQHKHVPVKVDFIDANETATEINLYRESVSNAGSALAKSIVDFALAKVVAANFSEESVYALADSDLDMLSDVRLDMNAAGAPITGRFGIVNSGVFATLNKDSRITSGDYHGQRIGAEPLGHLTNIEGFGHIWEYPDLPANGENLSGFFGAPGAIIISTRVPTDINVYARMANIPQIAKFETMTDPDTGLTLLGITWMEPGTFDLHFTASVMYGAVAGSQAGSTGALLDLAGHRVVTS